MNPCKQKKKICEKSSFSFPSNHLSTKQLHAQMIRNNTKMTYNNTRMTTIYSNILGMDFETNRNMVIQYKYTCYMRYYTNLLQGNIQPSIKNELSQMLTDILNSLSQEEYNLAFQIEPPTPTPPPIMTNAYGNTLMDSGKIFYIIQRKTIGRNYFIFKNIPPNFLFKLNTYYTFDLSDISNLNTKLSFSEDENSGIPYLGVQYISTPGTPGAKMILNVFNDIKSLQLYTFNDTPMYDWLKYDWGYSTREILTQLYYIEPLIIEDYLFLYARQYSILSVYELSGPKYAITDYVEPYFFFTDKNPYRYKFTYGTYYLEIPKTFAATLLNKGYEDCVVFIGDQDKKFVSNVYGVDFADGPPNEGEYNFYYGQVKMIIYKPFPFNMSIYSKDFGFMGGNGLLYFTEDHRESPKTNVLNLSPLYSNTIRMDSLLRFNQDTTVNTKRKYGFNIGTYSLDIPDDLPIGFMTKNKDHLFIVEEYDDTNITGPFSSPDGNNYFFYTGVLTIHITGNFDTLSICTRNGYSGGYKLLAYNSTYGASLPYVYKTKDNIDGLSSQTTIGITMDAMNSSIYFNDKYNTNYGLYNGTYMIFNIPIECPITLLNRGKENLVSLESLQKKGTIQGIGPDGTIYTFYYGILRITVHGDFGFMTLYTLYNDYMGGFKMFSYDPFFDNRDSYPDTLSIPIIEPALPNRSFTEIKMDDILYRQLTFFSENLKIEYENIWYRPYEENVVNISTQISFNDDLPNMYIRYNVNSRIYVLSCLSHYITLLNKGKEDLIVLKGNLSRKEIASDGNEYTFYNGDMIALYVFGDFNLVSLEVFGGPVGNFILVYSDII